MDTVTSVASEAPSVIFVANRPFALLGSRLHLMRMFQENGWQVIAATAADEDAKALEEMGVTVRAVDFARKGLAPARDVIALWRLGRIYLHYRPKLIHHFHAKPTLFGNMAAWLVPKARSVNTITGLGNALGSGRLTRLMASLGYRLSLKRSDVTIFQNPDDHRVFVTRRWVPEYRTRVIVSSGVDLERFHTRESTATPSGPPRILMVARLLWPKGVAEFVKAAEICRRTLPEARFQLAGELDPDHPEAVDKAWIDEQVKAGKIEFLGFRSRLEEELAEVYTFVLPSYYGEGVPRVLLEASACGVPVVTADVPGCREALVPGETGLVIPPRDARALADAVGRLIADPTLRKDMGARARQLMESRFDTRAIAREYASIYESIGAPVEGSCAPSREF